MWKLARTAPTRGWVRGLSSSFVTSRDLKHPNTRRAHSEPCTQHSGSPCTQRQVRAPRALSTTWCQPTCNDVVQQGGGHAEDAHQQIADSQVQDEKVRDRAHVFLPQDDKANHTVAHHTEEEDQEVRDDEDSCHGRLMKVEVHVGDIAF